MRAREIPHALVAQADVEQRVGGLATSWRESDEVLELR